MTWDRYKNEAKDAVALKLQRLAAAGERFVPLSLPGKNPRLVSSFWAAAWCRHLEFYHDYETRLPRGRSYLRGGNVYNLEIQPGLITAQVTGSAIYDVRIPVEPLSQENQKALQEACTGSVATLLDLFSGKLNETLLQLVTHPTNGLFPAPSEIRFVCSCPDWASLCKHAAAVLYGVAVRFDADPSLFFLLRGIEADRLIAGQSLAAASHSQEIPEEHLSSIFGIDLTPTTSEPTQTSSPVRKSGGKKKPPRSSGRSQH